MDQPYTRVTERFRANGIDLNNPLDSVRPGYYPVLENVRCYTDGVIQPRQGLSATNLGSVVASKTPVHSVRRLNDPNTVAPNNYIRVVGAGDALAWWDPATNTFTRGQYNASNIVFSGNPLTMVPFRPDQSVASWMYIVDTANMYKMIGYNSQSITKGTTHLIGLPPPTTRAVAELGFPYEGPRLNFESTAGWVGDTVIITTPSIATAARVNTTISRVLFDAGSSGWCCIVPTSPVQIGVNSLVSITAAGPTIETHVVYEVYPGTAASATVAQILYDNDPTNTGTCTITPSMPLNEFRRNAVVLLNGATYARITHHDKGPDGSVSFRCTTGAATIAAGQSMQVVSSFRVYSGGCANGDPITQSNLAFPTTGAGTGYIQNNTAIDMTRIVSAGSVAAMSDDDYIHLSIKVDDLSKFTSGRIIFNCDATDTACTQNFFFRPISPNDIVPIAKGTQTAIDNRNNVISRRLLDSGGSRLLIPTDSTDVNTTRLDSDVPDFEPVDPNATNPDSPSRSQTGTGDNQWSEIRFRRGELQRVGSETTRGFANITGIRLEFTCTAVITIGVNSLVFFGGWGPDTADLGAPYIYRFRYRASSTGARGNFSPTVFEGIVGFRSQIVVTMSASTAPEVDKIDIERIGGSLTEWIYVGTVPNATASFTDTISDDKLIANAPYSEGDSNFQPWPITDVPFATTATVVAGTSIKTSAALPINMAKGTPMLVNGIATSYRRTISQSAKIYEIADSVAGITNIAVEVPEPVIQNQYLPTWWGPFNGSFFACGLSSASNTKNPGNLYWTTPNNPDSTTESNFLEVTSPSEPLINGCVFNGRNYVWSSERMFEIQAIGPGIYIAIEVPGNKGLISRWALATGERIWYGSRDGIYQSGGGDSISITDETLRPLFAREGSSGQAVNGFSPPDMTATTKLRLSYYKGYVYFLYQDTNAGLRCLTYTARAEKPGWWPDVYGGDTGGITYLYGDEGQGANLLLACGNDATTGKLYSVTGTSDGGANIAGRLRTQYFDAQDRRADKHWGDFILDADPNSATLNVTAYLNASTGSQLALTPASMTGAGRSQKIFDISSGGDPAAAYARNMALEISWASTTSTPNLYLWEPSYSTRPESIDLRATNWNDDGYNGDKFFQGIEVDADTFGISRTVVIEYDGSTGNVADTFSINHTNRQQKAYAFRPAFTAHTVRLHPTDGSNTWALYGCRWIWQPEPPTADRWEGQQTSLSAEQFLHLKSAYVMLRSTQDVTFTITRTEDSVSNTYTIPTTSGLKKRVYVPFVATKGKAFIFVLTSTGVGGTFRLYKPETTVLAKPWASGEAFHNLNPFGLESGEGKAPI